MTRILLFSLALLLVSCSEKPDFGTYHSVPYSGWNKADSVVFEVDTLPPGLYDIVLGVRSSVAQNYPYRNLDLQVCQLWTGKPDTLGHAYALRCDTVLTLLPYDREGEPKGEGLSLHDYEMPVGTTCITDSAAARITVTHCMRSDTISGLSEVGIILRRKNGL